MARNSTDAMILFIAAIFENSPVCQFEVKEVLRVYPWYIRGILGHSVLETLSVLPVTENGIELSGD